MIGQRIDGKYEIVKLIGEGAMGAVYEARHGLTGRKVALKVVTDEAAKDETLVARFEREAKAAAKLVTPHIVEILDTGVDRKHNLPFIVMDLLSGENVRSLLERLGPLPPPVAVRIAGQVCLGLDKAHAAGVVHRDLKPANLFLSKGRQDERMVKLLDFGVAKLKMDHATITKNESLSRTGSVAGSPMYMSPEQARGHQLIDHRTDIWSVGAVLYDLLCGEPPYKKIKGLADLVLAICSEEPPSVRDQAPWVSPEIADVVHGALRLEPGDRFESAAKMIEALEMCVPQKWRITEEMLVALTDEERGAYRPEPATRRLGSDEAGEPPPAAGDDEDGADEQADDDLPPPDSERTIGEVTRPAGLRVKLPGRRPVVSAFAKTVPSAGLDDALAEVDQAKADLDAPYDIAGAPAPITSSPTSLAPPPRRGFFGSSLGRLILGIAAGAIIGAIVVVAYNFLGPGAAGPAATSRAEPTGQATPAETATAEPSASTPAGQPSDAEDAGAADAAPDEATAAERTVRVKITPAFAGVAVNGTRTPPDKEGYIELTGELGSAHDVIVTVAGKHKAVRVYIAEEGAKPPQIIFVTTAKPTGPAEPPSEGDLYE